MHDSVSLNTYGNLWIITPSSGSGHYCTPLLHEGDYVRMEVDHDPTPRTVQFFVNGKAGKCLTSGIPSSVRIGFSVSGEGTSIRIDNIYSLSRPTPIPEGMEEKEW
ncbi:hypothetical protein BLNAU_7673 [Blattamonas nauphoetae]|uniref:Uncharacterized protein n=1 Tax=Blattamonas nauphoetae TaxID=2049346 RepID=A0ABQ9Y0P4_9EUKA|nr:hypothetical protein BLNAU_7673 [Blattamonas nauphoetae]